MTHKKRILLLVSCILISIFRVAQAQALTGEARSHWNKASIYLENATTDNEWQLAINELEQVIKFAPGFSEAYLKLGDAYSKIITADAVNKAKYYWKEYERMIPSSDTTIHDKIDRLEAQYEMASVRIREKIIESLIGRWRRDKDSPKDFWQGGCDMEIFREGNKLMLRYLSFYYWYNGGRDEPGGWTSYKEIPLNGDTIIIEYNQSGEWRDLKNGEIVDRTKYKYAYRFVVSQPQIDGVIKGTQKVSSAGWNPPVSDIYVYKVN